MKVKKKAKAKVVKAVAKKMYTKRKTKGTVDSWEVWSVVGGKYSYDDAYETEAQANEYCVHDTNLVAPVIVHVVIPQAEY